MGGAAGVPFGESTLQERLKKGQFAFAGKGVHGHYGDHSEGAAEAFTLLARVRWKHRDPLQHSASAPCCYRVG